MESGALGQFVGEEVGEVHEEVFGGGLEGDVEQFGRIAAEGVLGGQCGSGSVGIRLSFYGFQSCIYLASHISAYFH